MKKEKRLAKEAVDAAKKRGHEIAPFTFISHKHVVVGRAYCKHCNMMVTIDSEAAPVEEAIKGDAIELNCF